MNKRINVDLGDGVKRKVSYYELRKLLQNIPWHIKRPILEKYFSEELSSDLNNWRWDRFLQDSGNHVYEPYWLTHSNLLKRAALKNRINLSNNGNHTVSDFTDWIYDLRDVTKDLQALSRGKAAESRIGEKKKLINELRGNSDWRLLYRDPIVSKPEPLEISHLTVHGHSIYGAPDYVFKNDKTNTVLIVEVKVSNRSYLCSDGWPNLRAQLWAYGHIDCLINDSENIVLVGEVWGELGGDYFLRQTLQWDFYDQKFYDQNMELFEAYKAWAENKFPQIE